MWHIIACLSQRVSWGFFWNIEQNCNRSCKRKTTDCSEKEFIWGHIKAISKISNYKKQCNILLKPVKLGKLGMIFLFFYLSWMLKENRNVLWKASQVIKPSELSDFYKKMQLKMKFFSTTVIFKYQYILCDYVSQTCISSLVNTNPFLQLTKVTPAKIL